MGRFRFFRRKELGFTPKVERAWQAVEPVNYDAFLYTPVAEGLWQQHEVWDGTYTLEDLLDVVKGKGTLFIELKGVTADRQMADDVVRMVREKDCVGDVVLISLAYDVIDYAERTYPEFETGVPPTVEPSPTYRLPSVLS